MRVDGSHQQVSCITDLEYHGEQQVGIGKNANTCALVTRDRIFRSWGEQFQHRPVRSNAFKIESQAYPTQDHQREEGSKEQSKRGAVDPSSELGHSPHHDSKKQEERTPRIHRKPSCEATEDTPVDGR